MEFDSFVALLEKWCGEKQARLNAKQNEESHAKEDEGSE
jgi:hypothetical protein